MVQLNLNLTEHVCNMGLTRHFLIHMRESMHVHARLMMIVHNSARKIDDVKPTLQSSHARTRCVHNSLQMHACMSGMHMPNLDYACLQIVSHGQWYKHVHVLRCNPLMIQDANPAKESLTVKLKWLEGVSLTDYHR